MSELRAHAALFGGTFDPVHNGHLAIARAAAERFSLERVLFVPAGNPPHKADQAIASYEDRVHMLELARGQDARFEVSRIEEGSASSFSILTIEKLLAAGCPPLAFLIGADAFAEIRTWRRWRDVIASVEFIVVTRGGFKWSAPEGARVHELTVDKPISSSAVRARIADGAGDVPVPAEVLNYIRHRGLYGSPASSKSELPNPREIPR